MPGRTYNSSSYRFGFGGQEKSNEIKGEGNSYTAEFWEYDPRLVRRWNVDPIIKEYESPYSAFANNPIVNIDPDGSDTLTFTHKTTFDKRKYRPASYSKGGLDNYPSKMIDPGNNGISKSGSIDIKQADGDDVFYYQTVNATIDENGNETITGTTTTQFNPQGAANMGYRKGAHSIKGYALDDRYFLSEIAPKWLIDDYYSKSLATNGQMSPNTWAWGSAKAYTKDLEFFRGVQRVSNVVYTASGIYGVARLALSRTVFTSMTKGGVNAYTHKFSYAARVRMRAVEDPVSHNFPYSFDDAILGTNPILKNNGYKMFQLNGTMNNKSGVFEIGLTKDGVINHRFFRPF